MNKTSFLLLAAALIFSAPRAFAQHAGEPLWLDADGTFNLMSYDDGSHTQKAQLAGVRGELGFAYGYFGITIGAQYMDGNTSFEGESLTGNKLNVTTRDYLSDYRGMLHLMFGGVELAGGLAQGEWFDANGAYRTRFKSTYVPVTVTISSKMVYFRLEADKLSKMAITATTSDLGGGATDTAFTQNAGFGYGAELGVRIPSSLRIESRVFVAYHHWEMDPSTVASDGPDDNMAFGKTKIDMVSAGVGLGF